MSEFLRSVRKIEPRQFSLDTLLVQRCLKCSVAPSQILKLCQQPLQRFDFSRGQLTHAFKGLFKGFHPLLQFTHFLRRSFSSLGESRVALGARPATRLTTPAPSSNIQFGNTCPTAAAPRRAANPDTLTSRTVAEITALRAARIAAWSNADSESRLPQFPLIRDLRPLDERRAELYARELRECAAFAVFATVTLYGLLSIGGV
jgi:hypothetical protein